LQHQTSNIKHQSEEMGFGAIIFVALLGLAPVAPARPCIHCQNDRIIDPVAIAKGEAKDPCAQVNIMDLMMDIMMDVSENKTRKDDPNSRLQSITDCGDKLCRSTIYFGVRDSDGENWKAAERNCDWPQSETWVSLPEESKRRNMICEERRESYDGKVKRCYRTCDAAICNTEPLNWMDKNQKMALEAEFFWLKAVHVMLCLWLESFIRNAAEPAYNNSKEAETFVYDKEGLLYL